MLISKKELAKSCGVQLSTVYNWIKSDKAGITEFITEGMIQSAIFDREPFKQMRINAEMETPEQSDPLATALREETATALQAEVSKLKIRIQELESQNGALSATVNAQQSIIESKDSIIESKQGVIDSKQSEIDTLKADVAFLRTQIPPRLPEPQGFFSRLFRHKKQ